MADASPVLERTKEWRGYLACPLVGRGRVGGGGGRDAHLGISGIFRPRCLFPLAVGIPGNINFKSSSHVGVIICIHLAVVGGIIGIHLVVLSSTTIPRTSPTSSS